MGSTMDDLIRKLDEEEDEEIMCFILSALYVLTSGEQREKRPRHTSRLSGKERLKEILEGHRKDCCVAFRMEPIVSNDIFVLVAVNYLQP
jgi:hypothetical protein